MAASCLSVARYTVTPLMAALDVQLTDEDLDFLMKLVSLLYLGITFTFLKLRNCMLNNRHISFFYKRSDNRYKLLQRQLDNVDHKSFHGS